MREIHQGRFDDLDGPTVFALARLRQEVFVVEQDCPYPDLDGKDLDPETVHFWADGDAAASAAACLRLLRDGGERRIGRVCCVPAERGTGLSGRLMTAALEQVEPGVDVVLDAQTYAAGFYRKFGFAEDCEEFMEDGIPHVPMRRRAKA